ncbi:MAG: peptidoglycan-associated lipoprotein Pal [Alphaproteobacteria bacterium]
MKTKVVTLIAGLFLLAACTTAGDQGAGADAGGGAAAAPQVAAAVGIVPGSQEDLAVNVGDRVYFAFDKFDLTDEAQNALRAQAQWLARNPSVTVTIEGHADERGTREYNLALGERRANSAKEFLVALGVDGSRVTVISFGKERPAVLGSNEAAWALNRRAVTVVNPAE